MRRLAQCCLSPPVRLAQSEQRFPKPIKCSSFSGRNPFEHRFRPRISGRQAASELLKTITPAKIENWTCSEPMDWANESFAIAEQARTEYCIRQVRPAITQRSK